jgi:phosphoserine phosphatase RsbU/P
MTEQILLPPSDAPHRKFWKSWKWIGLAVFAIALVFRQSLPGLVLAAAYIYGIVVIANLIRQWFFWRVRNRLLGFFIFVGVIPLLVLLGVVLLAANMLLGRLAGQYFNQAIQENEQLIAKINFELAGNVAYEDPESMFRAKAAKVFSSHSTQFPHLAARLLHRRPDGALEIVSKYDPQNIVRDLSPHPGDKWRGDAQSFEGLLKDREKAFITSLLPVRGSTIFYLETTAALDSLLEDRLGREKSLYILFIQEDSVRIIFEGNRLRFQNANDKNPESGERGATQYIAGKIASNRWLLDFHLRNDSRSMVSGFEWLRCKTYESGKDDSAVPTLFKVPREILLKTYLNLDSWNDPTVLFGIIFLAGMFVVSTIIFLIIGLTISRHITKSVHDMYQGILALQKGDLQYRIPVRRKDQLGLLAHSFNQMSAMISRLLDEVVEKKRLEKELEIAREVQSTFFPKQLPHPPGISIFGGCKPAQVVSGDYYDFIVEDDTHLNIVVGDISGKGISAALLMANLQAAMRSQLLSSKHDNPDSLRKNLADVMTQLNRQIHLNSPAEKYATLFLCRYDADSRRLWYCNAGHPPPILLNGKSVYKLEATGTVVGIFPNATYEARSIDLPPGALLAIYTDGVTEALNKDDEEFGEKKLLEALQQSSARSSEEIWNHVVSKVGEWQSGLPQYDDITLIIAKTGQ